jgi:hypothetical protein
MGLALFFFFFFLSTFSPFLYKFINVPKKTHLKHINVLFKYIKL